ncbi:uncharacterized protein LOC135958602 [Calliphora vicina]|uniref:uncharacterized protein LOC135958602 n=1 Tax=Calliphora vicina TaxID=7373 RepID=UPI00325BEE1F
MRRSKAPSVLNKAKRVSDSNDYSNETEVGGHDSDPEDEQYNWGSRTHNGEIKPNRFENKRIFNIVWRDISTKKHKTWKGDGTLEVNNLIVKAILKDETGKYLGCSTKFNKNDIAPDFQMVIGGKEIEIQNEITEEDELHELRKRQVLNRNWGEEWISPKELTEEDKKPKGSFKFKPILMLKPPEVPLSVNLKSNWETKETQKQNTSFGINKSDICSSSQINLKTPPSTGLCREFICFVRPSELQQFLLLKAVEYYTSVKSCLTLEKIQSLDIDHILKHICNHPSFINHKSTTNELMRYLIPTLPDWSEMGPFDSGKLEFVQYFLSDLTKFKPQHCIILAINSNVLNMLQGLCDFMNIKCLRLNTNLSKDDKSRVIDEFCSSEKDLTQVLLVNSQEVMKTFDLSTYCNKLIIFEEFSKNINISNLLHKYKEMSVYYLVTAFSIEELLLLDTYNNNNRENLLELIDELVNISNMDNDCCYLHSKIECNCFESTDECVNANNIFIKNWQHFKIPFDVQLLKISSLENSAENIVSIFCRNLHL